MMAPPAKPSRKPRMSGQKSGWSMTRLRPSRDHGAASIAARTAGPVTNMVRGQGGVVQPAPSLAISFSSAAGVSLCVKRPSIRLPASIVIVA